MMKDKPRFCGVKTDVGKRHQALNSTPSVTLGKKKKKRARRRKNA